MVKLVGFSMEYLKFQFSLSIKEMLTAGQTVLYLLHFFLSFFFFFIYFLLYNIKCPARTRLLKRCIFSINQKILLFCVFGL